MLIKNQICAKHTDEKADHILLHFSFKYCIDHGGMMVEIVSEEKGTEIDKFVKTQQDFKDKACLWMALRKYECWVWNSDTPMCHTNWKDEGPTDSGGKR
jgi:hypothetical protein